MVDLHIGNLFNSSPKRWWLDSKMRLNATGKIERIEGEIIGNAIQK